MASDAILFFSLGGIIIVLLALLLLYIVFIHKSPYQLLIAYGEECKESGVDMFDTLKLLEHYAFWDLGIRGTTGGDYWKDDDREARTQAKMARNIVFFGEKTRENTKPRIRIPADIG